MNEQFDSNGVTLELMAFVYGHLFFSRDIALKAIASALLGLFVVVTGADAGEKTLSAEEISALLSGNTAIGRWIDHNYRQYFDASGSTIYAQENARSAVGRWRVNAGTNQYESWWEQSGWGSGYTVIVREGVYHWVGGGAAKPQAFTLVEGQKLVAGRNTRD
jgi:hypothetical protein